MEAKHSEYWWSSLYENEREGPSGRESNKNGDEEGKRREREGTEQE